MQRLSLKLVRTFCRTVYCVPQKRMSDARHMDADLVSPSRLQPALDMGEILESRDHPVMGHKLTELYEEGYACAERVLTPYLKV